MNAIKVLVAIVALFWGSAQAALVDTSICMNPSGCGYYLPYEGRLAGFFNGDLSGTPILQMSINPGIYPPPNGTPVTLFSYNDVMAAGSSFTLEEQVKLSQIGAFMNDIFSASTFFSNNGISPPTTCALMPENCNLLSSEANIVAWNIWAPNLVPTGGSNIEFYTSGTYDEFNWINSMLLMQISGGDTFVIPLGGATPETLMTQTPIPASAWLFGSGMLGLVAVSRRRAYA